MTRLLVLLALAGFAGAALADPFSTVAALSTFAGAAAGTGTFLGLSSSTWLWVGVAASALGAIDARRKARKAAAKARADYNAGLQDRTVSVLRTDPPWQVIYGRAIVGGAILDIVTNDKPNARRENGATYTKPDAYKTIVLQIASHEVEAIHEVYIDGVAVGAVDANGIAASGSPFFAQREDSRQVTFTNSVTISEPLVQVFSAYTGTGDAQEPVTVTIVGNQLVSATPDVSVTCNYSVTMDTPVVRISKQLGSDTQTTNTLLSSIAPSRYTSNHRLRGIAYVVVQLDLEDERFQGGPPNITVDVSGRKVFDPRTSTTAWSANPALCIRDFLTAPWGFEVASGDVDDASVIVAANACDELIDLTIGATTETDQPRFTCNGAFTTDQNRESVLEDLVDSMAGMVTYSAKWRLLAGTWSASVMTLTDDDLHGQIEVVQADTPMSELFNGIRGQLFLAGAQSPSDFNPYSNATFVADDGRELWTTATLNWTNHLARARNLCRIMVEKNRAGQVIRYPAKLKAWPLQIGDRVTVTSSEYGITSKLYRVTDWSFEATGAVDLTLQEDAAELYDLADAAVADPTPNTDIADPWAVPALSGLSATSGGTTLMVMGDGTIVPRVLVSWTAITAGNVLGGGAVEVLWRSQTTTTWTSTLVAGSEVQAWLQGVTEGDVILIEARARNALGRSGPSTFLVHTVVGKTAPPTDVIGFAWAIKPSQVQVNWDPCPDADYAATELRVGTTWATATLLFKGAATQYNHPRPANGTYTVLAKHVDTSGNYSLNAASVTITVDDSIDPAGGAGTLKLVTDRYPYFAFPDATSHTTSSVDLVITAQLVRLKGTPAWTAEAFDEDGISLGAVALTGEGLVRTMTGAAFAAPGTLGSVRTVVVTATLAGASDDITIYRQDPSVTAARLFLSNERVAIATDENGENGDFSDASTEVQVYVGITDVTSLWSFAITPDAGVTATINGGAGPVSGTAAVVVAASAMTVPDGAVLITATRSGWPTLTKSFIITKSEAQGDLNIYWEPRTEIVLPVGTDGAVSSYADAWSRLMIVRAGGIDDTANWTFSKADTNVTSTLTGNRVDVTALLSLGQTGTVTTTTVVPTGATNLGAVYAGGGRFLAVGVNTGASYQAVRVSTDFINWTEKDVGLAARWNRAAYAQGAWLLFARFSITTAVRRSTDGGNTWGAGTAMPSSIQVYDASSNGATVLVTGQTSTAGFRSTDGGASWSGITLPEDSCLVHPLGDGGQWLAWSATDRTYRSLNNGSTWTEITSQLPNSVWNARRFKGRTFVTHWWDSGAQPTISVASDGQQFQRVTLPASYQRGNLVEVAGVLYLHAGGAGIMYTVDGERWQRGVTTIGGNAVAFSPASIEAAFLPLWNGTSGQVLHAPLTATSDSVGAVTVTARQAGKADIVRTIVVRKGTPNQDVYTFAANPFVLYLPATADGVVTSFANATITARAERNGVVDSDNWTWTWTATNLTPSSGTTPAATFTAMDSAQDVGIVSFRATRAGFRDVTGSLEVRKQKSNVGSGPLIGSAYTVIDTTNTYLALRFDTDGWVRVKRGSSGSFVNLTPWAGLTAAGVGASHWLRVMPRPGSHALASGTVDTWLQLSTARDYVLEDTAPGTHRVDFDVAIGFSSTGLNAVLGAGAMQLIVP